MPYVLALRGEPELEAAFLAVKLEAILADQLQSLGLVNLEGIALVLLMSCIACILKSKSTQGNSWRMLELFTRYLLKYLGQKSIFLLP